MKLIVGLGNPGKKYTNNHHNLGAQIVTKYLDTNYKAIPNRKTKLSSDVFEVNNGSQKIIFAIPTEWMNNSGLTVKKLADFNKIDPKDIFVIHDDLDLPIGEYRLQFDRGPAGHNGIKSIIDNLGTQQFNRLRIGIGKPQDNIPVEDYVLQPFSKKELSIIESIIPKIFQEIDKII